MFAAATRESRENDVAPAVLGCAAPGLRRRRRRAARFSGQLTGDHADLGVQGRNGASLAVEDSNARGGVAGRPLKLLSRDDGDTPQTAVDADTALLKAGVVAIVGHMTSSQTLAALPTVAAAGRVMISPTTATPELSGKNDLFFRVIPSNESWGLALGAYAARRGLTKVCVIADLDNASYVESFNAAFERAFGDAGCEIVCRFPFSSKQGPDWGALLELAATSRAQGIVATAAARHPGLWHARLRQPRRRVPCTGCAQATWLASQPGRQWRTDRYQ